jgi:CheY-like chemotaxis protein
VLTDLVMPNMRGADLAERLRLARPDLRIVLMSGYPDQPAVQRLGRNSLAVLPKPFTSIELVDKVRQVLDTPWHGQPAPRTADG